MNDTTPTRWRCACGVLLLLAWLPRVGAETILVAVASNALPATQAVADAFSRTSGHDVRLASGSTGKLYAQIVNGAPFDLFLAADVARPQQLQNKGYVVKDGRFTYAVGRLVLWSPQLDEALDEGCRELLLSGDYRWLAIANPRLAPYGLAAQQTLQQLGIWKGASLVRGESVGQAYQFVLSGNAELGFVAASQLAVSGAPGCRWAVDAHYHEPLRQQAVWLQRARQLLAARAFFHFLQSPQAAAIFTAYGYRMP